MSKKIELVITQSYLNPFAAEQTPKLCADLADYIVEEAGYNLNLSLEISCLAEEHDRLCKAISNTFEQKISQRRSNIRLLRLQALVMLAIAIVMAVVFELLEIKGTIPVGLVTVTAWMLVWRTAEIILLDIRAGNAELRKYQRIINAPKQFI